uniref:Uncharacterized protein n=1 Tax=viral metagenome TaxID=1070528 RepID=A0A6C0DH29_9ZZZZ
MFGRSTRDYGLGPGRSSTQYTAPSTGFFGSFTGFNPFGSATVPRQNPYGYGASTGFMGSFGRFNPFGASSGYSSSYSTGWKAIVGYILSVSVILLMILLLVHYFVRPIFQLSPGGPGFIPVPGLNDSELFWKPGTVVSPIKDIQTRLAGRSANFTMTMDIVILNPLTFSNKNRPIFMRGSSLDPDPGKKGKSLDVTSITVALKPDTTDMVIILMNSSNNEEPITIPNVPVQTPFRLGIVIMDMAMEAYINGKLIKTRTLDASPRQSGGDFSPPQGQMVDLARVNNLQLWDRVLTPSEIRYSKPSLEPTKPTDINLIPSVSVCDNKVESEDDIKPKTD